jgi:hypothetical protein
MRPMSFPSSLPLAAGLAIALSSPVIAEPAVSSTPTRAGSRTDLRVDRDTTLGAPGQRAALPRASDASPRDNNFGGAFVTMHDALENFPLNTNLGGDGVSAAPTSFTGPPGFVWPLNNLRGQPDGATSGNIWARVVDLSFAPVGGANGVVNATKALRIQTAAAVPPGRFLLGANLRFGGQPGEPTLPFAPTADHNARISAEYFISTIDQNFTFEPVSVFTGFITGRLYWGGQCVEDNPGDCTDFGLPVGLVSAIYALGPCNGFCTGGEFAPSRYCTTREGAPIPGCTPHPGFAVGDPVPPTIANWSRFAAETTSDGSLRFLLDRLDGAGETIISDQQVFTSGFIDQIAANTSFEVQDAFVLIDNIEASGPVFALPKAPPLECPYLDDMEWLIFGPLRGQNPRWDAALSSAANVINDGARGQVIQQVNNVSQDNKYRREIATFLEPSSATLANDLVATVQVRTTGSTVRGFALFNDDQLAARVLLNYWPTDSLDFDEGVYVQVNPSYVPIDDPLTSDPLANAPVIGVDILDTQYDWDNDAVYRTLELRLSANGVLRVSIDGQRIYTGAGAFSNSIDRFAFESENNAFGSGAQLRINDVTLACDAPSCAADFNLDDVVDFADLNAALSNFGASGLPAGVLNAGDANADGVVDFNDLNAVLSAFGTTCE